MAEIGNVGESGNDRIIARVSRTELNGVDREAGTRGRDTCDCTSGLPSTCAGTANAITSASESGTTVTITMTSANPTGLTIGNNVTVANVNVAGYNGTFVVTAIPTGTTYQYTAASALGAGTGGPPRPTPSSAAWWTRARR